MNAKNEERSRWESARTWFTCDRLSLRRLAAEISCYEPALEERKKRNTSESGDAPSWCKASDEYLRKAKDALKRCHIQRTS